MKELSIKEKAQRYDEAFIIAQKLYNDPNSSNVGKGYVCTVFPEVKESEDERIRNDIILYIGARNDISLNIHNKWLSWLEKQGKQNLSIEMKSAEESLGIDSDTYNKIVDECIYGEQKPTDKIENEIEIPFGAKDSELQEATYYIPKGFYAEIDGNKVVIKKGNQKPAWSKEDEKNLQGIIDEIEANKNNAPDYDLATYDRFLDWLKSLKPQNKWKPSDEQMNELHNVFSSTSGGWEDRVVESLYNDLKKLKGE